MLTYGMQYNQDIWFQIVLILKVIFEGNILLLLLVFIYILSTELISIMSTHDIGN